MHLGLNLGLNLGAGRPRERRRRTQQELACLARGGRAAVQRQLPCLVACAGVGLGAQEQLEDRRTARGRCKVERRHAHHGALDARQRCGAVFGVGEAGAVLGARLRRAGRHARLGAGFEQHSNEVGMPSDARLVQSARAIRTK